MVRDDLLMDDLMSPSVSIGVAPSLSGAAAGVVEGWGLAPCSVMVEGWKGVDEGRGAAVGASASSSASAGGLMGWIAAPGLSSGSVGAM